MKVRLPLLLLATLVAACSKGGDATAPAPAAALAVAVATNVLAPTAAMPPAVDLQRLGLERIDAYYRLSTPAGVPFTFDALGWEGAHGFATVGVAHVRDGGATPSGGVETMAAAGLALTGSGLWVSEPWFASQGDGLARVTVQGTVTQSQLLALRGEGGGGVLVEIGIGEPSVINQEVPDVPAHPGVVDQRVIYSSDAWNFGLPTLGVSGDRTSIVCYEGDRQAGMNSGRYELRLQHDRTTQAVTGGASQEPAPDTGSWRDHEVAALYNVLAVGRNEIEGARVLLSFDRGATFGQQVRFGGASPTRLVQVAMALDYSLAVTWWDTEAVGGESLWLAEGRPVTYDGNGSPTWFQFDLPQRLGTMPPDSMPLTTGMAWSAGGDLVVGYAASYWEAEPVGWTSTSEFRCATRPYGGQFHDVLIETESVFARDPSVAVLGQGAGLQVFYAYEVSDGIRLASSVDAGHTFRSAGTFGGAGAHLPTVFARENGASTRVDVLYLAFGAEGTELHHSRWADFGAGSREDLRLTTATLTLSPPQAGRATLYGNSPPLGFGMRTRQVNWLGYDAVLDGDQLVIVYDEVTWDSLWLCYGAMRGFGGGSTTILSVPANFRPATPPPLAPGLTEPMPAPDPAHAHQLRLLRVE